LRFLFFALCVFSFYSRTPQKPTYGKVKYSQNFSNTILKKRTSIPKKHYKVLQVEFFSDVKCAACQKMHESLLQLQEFLLLKHICLKIKYMPIVTREDSINSALIATEAINQGKIDEFLESAYPKDKSTIDDLNPELIGAQIGITEIKKTQSAVSFIKNNQEILKKKAEGNAPLIIIRNYDGKNHDLNIAGCHSVEDLTKIIKRHKLIPEKLQLSKN